MDPIPLRFFILLSLLCSTCARSPSNQAANTCKNTSTDKIHQKKPCTHTASPQNPIKNEKEPPVFDTVALNCSSNAIDKSECIWYSTNKNSSQYLRFAVPENKTGLHEELSDLLRICPFLNKPELHVMVTEISNCGARLTWAYLSKTSMADLDYEITYAEQATPWIAKQAFIQGRLTKNSQGGSVLLTNLYPGMKHDVIIRATASSRWLKGNCQMKKIEPGEWFHSVSASFFTKRSPFPMNEGTFSLEEKDSRVVNAYWKHVQRRNERCYITAYELNKAVKTGACDNVTQYSMKISNKAHRIEIKYTGRKESRNHTIVVRVPAKENINSNFTFAVVTNGTGKYQLFWPNTNVTIKAELVGSNSSYLTWISNDTTINSAIFYAPDPVKFLMGESSSGLKSSSCVLTEDDELIDLRAVTSYRILFVTWTFACPRLPEILTIDKMLLIVCKTRNNECVEGTSQRYSFNSEASDLFVAEIELGQSYKIVGFGLSKNSTKVRSNEFHFLAAE